MIFWKSRSIMNFKNYSSNSSSVKPISILLIPFFQNRCSIKIFSRFIVLSWVFVGGIPSSLQTFSTDMSCRLTYCLLADGFGGYSNLSVNCLYYLLSTPSIWWGKISYAVKERSFYLIYILEVGYIFMEFGSPVCFFCIRSTICFCLSSGIFGW